MKAPLPSAEQELASHNSHTMNYTILTYSSRLHLADHPWEPEEDSPIARRALTASMKRSDRKFHWTGSQCGNVRSPKASTLGDRLMSGAKFNALPVDERCAHCHDQFTAA